MSVLVAPAKLTWSLHVTGVRPDGLHLLDAEMVTLELADTLELTELDGPEAAGAAPPRFSVAAEHRVARCGSSAGAPT